MAGRGQLGAAVVLAGMVGGLLPVSADGLQVTVHVENYARVPPGDWEIVQRQIDDIYRAAGITLVWAGPLRIPMSQIPRDGVRRLALVIVNILEPFGGSERDTADVLGRAAPDVSRAWVFANRVGEISKEGSVDANLLFARVAAHEIGHLLLRSKAHAPHGIMRAGLALTQVGSYRFTDAEAALMRDGIRRHVGF